MLWRICVNILLRKRSKHSILVTFHANYIFSTSYYIVICGLSRFTFFFTRYLLNGTTFENILEYKTCFNFLYKFCLGGFLTAPSNRSQWRPSGPVIATKLSCLHLTPPLTSRSLRNSWVSWYKKGNHMRKSSNVIQGAKNRCTSWRLNLTTGIRCT